MAPRALLLVNRASRRGRALRPLAVDRLRELGFRLVEDAAARFAELVRRHRAEVDMVIVGGGDGTLNRSLDALVDTGLPLGILPLGTANNVARTLGIPDDLAAACEIIAGGHLRRIDLGVANGIYFFTTASIGLSVRITEQLTAERKRRWGRLAYGLTAARVLWAARPMHAEIVWEGGSFHSHSVQIVVGNGRYYGSALPVADDARIDDQRLDLYTVERRRWWELLGLLPALKAGRHGEKTEVHTLRAREIEVRTLVPYRVNVDGELRTRTPARFQVRPAALAVFSPPST